MQGIYLIATYTFCRQCLEHKLQTTLSERIRLKHQKERDASLCSVFRMSTLELKKRGRQRRVSNSHTRWMKIRTGGGERRRRRRDYFDRGTAPKWWATCSKCCWMKSGEWREGGGREFEKEGARGWGPQWSGLQHCCLQTCVEAQKEGRLPSRAGGARGELVVEEALVGYSLLPRPFEAGQISNTALASSLAWNPHFCHRLASVGPL